MKTNTQTLKSILEHILSVVEGRSISFEILLQWFSYGSIVEVDASAMRLMELEGK